MGRPRQPTREEAPFDRDIAATGSYAYSTGERLSSKLAVARHTSAIVEALDLCGKRVADIGGGDGYSAIDLYDRSAPASIVSLDAAVQALAVARNRAGSRPLTFLAASAYELPFAGNTFDVALFRGVLHHLDDPGKAVREAARVARKVVVLEPNGYNAVLKIIEKVSRYHREHGERSFFAGTIDRWMREAGLDLVYRSFPGLVPYFCPDVLAASLKRLEPFVESIPFVSAIMCGTYVCVGEKPES